MLIHHLKVGTREQPRGRWLGIFLVKLITGLACLDQFMQYTCPESNGPQVSAVAFLLRPDSHRQIGYMNCSELINGMPCIAVPT